MSELDPRTLGAISQIARGLDRVGDTLVSPNVLDSNMEPANLVDVIDRHARAVFALAEAIENLAAATRGDND